MHVRAVAVAVVFAALALVASVASAQLQPGVHVDPGSPAGKQYSIPIDSARSDAAGGQGSAGSSAGANPPIFGVGVSPAKPVAASASATGSRARRLRTAARARTRASRAVTGSRPSRGHTTPRTGHRTAPRRAAAPRPGAQVTLASTTVGGNGWVALVLGGALVLVLGGAGGLLIRRWK